MYWLVPHLFFGKGLRVSTLLRVVSLKPGWSWNFLPKKKKKNGPLRHFTGGKKKKKWLKKCRP